MNLVKKQQPGVDVALNVYAKGETNEITLTNRPDARIYRIAGKHRSGGNSRIE